MIIFLLFIACNACSNKEDTSSDKDTARLLIESELRLERLKAKSKFSGDEVIINL